MHRIVLLKIGGKRLQLIKIVGALIVCAASLGVLDSIATLFRIIKQVEIAKTSEQIALSVFGLPPTALTSDVVMGFFMLPTAIFMLWLAVFVIGAMVYRSGGVILPVEENVEISK
ncbi:MAG: hypothetical protein J7K68_04585 [Candidatus Diapherotrites archaeon]|nr:hypothetical protein [Candidatus Diapherotrites archaeon]